MADVEMVEAEGPQDKQDVLEHDTALDASKDAQTDVEEDDSSEESDAEPAAVLQREKRTNAGNRYSKLLAAEEKADADAADGEFYTAEGWQEQADDEAFSGSEAEAPDDVSLHSSSSDDEDDNDADDQGEKELKKQERAERTGKTKKRKTMHDVYKPRPVKKPKIAHSAMATPTDGVDGVTPRPKKKSERVSWLPTDAEGPQRQSLRKLAVESKARVHDRLKEAEKHRLRTVAIMQAADQRKAAEKIKEMTQDERLAEAMSIEKKNAKSLNRWEESERIKEEERMEKLAALKNRTLEGPYVRHWSGQAVWCAGKRKHEGKDGNVQEIELETNNTIQANFRKKQEKERLDREAALHAAMNPGIAMAKPGETIMQPQSNGQTTPSQPASVYPNSIMFPPPQFGGSLPGIEAYALPPARPQQAGQPNHFTTQQITSIPTATHPTSGNSVLPLPPIHQPVQPVQPPPHYPATLAMYTLIVLENFKDLAETPSTAKSRAKDREDKDRSAISRVVLGFEQPAKGFKAIGVTPELCEITSRPARYRDPVTGLTYADRYAYKCIQRLVGGGYEWSNLVGAFVGMSGEDAMGRPAKGVPDVFVRKADATVVL